MTKDDVKEVFGIIHPDIWHTDEGQEVWFVEAPEPQIIYFKDDKVERVEYEPQPVKPDKKER